MLISGIHHMLCLHCDASMVAASGVSLPKKDIKYLDKDGYIHDVSDIKIPPWGTNISSFNFEKEAM